MDSNGYSMQLTHDSKEKKGKKDMWKERQRGKTLSNKSNICILVGNNMIPVKI